MAELSFAEVSRLLKADFDTGKLYWLPRDVSLFSDEKGAASGACKRWNSRYAGKAAFTSSDGVGYLMGRIFGRPYKAHRVIWLLAHGEWPVDPLDHINGIKSDNRLLNLRSVTQAENTRNQGIRSNNTSGVVGVSWDQRAGKWYASIWVGGRTINLGLFDRFEDAVAARKSAEAEHGFHPNHGRGGNVIDAGAMVVRRRC